MFRTSTGKIDPNVMLRVDTCVDGQTHRSSFLLKAGWTGSSVDHVQETWSLLNFSVAPPSNVRRPRNMDTLTGKDQFAGHKLRLLLGAYFEPLLLSPTDVWALNNRGLAYGQLGRWKKARRDFEEALRIDPGFEQARWNRDGRRTVQAGTMAPACRPTHITRRQTPYSLRILDALEALTHRRTAQHAMARSPRT